MTINQLCVFMLDFLRIIFFHRLTNGFLALYICIINGESDKHLIKMLGRNLRYNTPCETAFQNASCSCFDANKVQTI